MRLSTNYITFAAIGCVLAFITLGIGQVVDCDVIQGATSLTICGNGEPVAFIWKAVSFCITASGFYLWIRKNNPPKQDTTEE
jgi:hypothetical protein